MTGLMPPRATVKAFVSALVSGVVLGSLVQTQLNLLALVEIGGEIPFLIWLETTALDLVSFTPLYLLLFGCSFLVSQGIALAVTRASLKRWRALVCAVAGALGLWSAFELVDALAPPPTLIAATRTLTGSLLMALTAGLAGWLFARGLSGSGQKRAGNLLIWLTMVTGALVAPPGPAYAQSEVATWHVETLVDGLEHPWSLAFLPGGDLLVTERPGRLRRITADGNLLPEPVAGVPAVMASGQAGLFEVSLAPDFVDSRWLYLSYACGRLEANHTCLARGRLQGNELRQVEELFRTRPAKRGSAHYGGRIAWLPDRTLVLSLGDGFDYREEAQKLSSHLGTLVRLNPDGSVPSDNPFLNRPGALPEIYSYGHRNVQGLVYDGDNGRLIAHEHGPRGGDELNIVEPGGNYGWPLASHGLDYTGARVTPFTDYPDTRPPLLHWTPSIAPSGMALYVGDRFPDWQGQLLIGALADRSLYRVSLAPAVKELQRMLGGREQRIRDVRMGPDGLVYLLTDHDKGQVVRLVPE